jgi:hypothetical protein
MITGGIVMSDNIKTKTNEGPVYILDHAKEEKEFLKGVIKDFEKMGDTEAAEYHKKLLKELCEKTIDDR